jgi:hypothetical protein
VNDVELLESTTKLNDMSTGAKKEAL